MFLFLFSGLGVIHAETRLGSREELAELRAAGVPRLLKVLTEGEKTFTIVTRPRAVNPWSRVTSWEIAKKSLQMNFEEARPGLTAFLSHPERLVRANALDVLKYDGLIHRRSLKKRVLLLLDDRSGMVRRKAVGFLGGIVDEEVEGVLAARLSSFARDKEQDLGLMYQYVTAITAMPVKQERVAKVMLHLLDHRPENGLLGYAVGRSKQFASSEKHALEFYRCYWHIVTTTEDKGLLSRVTDGLGTKDPRSLAFLLKAPALKSSTARAFAVSKLMSHCSFDPVKRREIFDSLLQDGDAGVRLNAASALVNRHDLSAIFRIPVILEAHEREKVPKVKSSIYAGLFTVLQYLPLDEKMRVLADQKLALAVRVVRDLQDESLKQLILSNSVKVMGKAYPRNHPSRDELAEKVEAWWLQFSPKGAK